MLRWIVFVLVGLVVLGLPAGASAEGGCSNEQLRSEQPYGTVLPDCRAYEMVSPLDKSDTDAIAQQGGALRARGSVSGEAISYDSFGAFAGAAGSSLVNQYLSRRGPGGWSTQGITPPTGSSEGNTTSDGPYQDLLFTPDLASGVTSVATSTGTPALASGAPAGYTNLYVADLAARSYRVVTSVVPPGIPLNDFEEFETYGPFLGGASADLSHVVFADRASLTPGAPANALNVYEWVNGQLSLVNVAPDGTPMAGGATPGAGIPSSLLFRSGADQWHSVSSDGSRVFFISPLLNPKEERAEEEGRAEEVHQIPQLYVRENGATTVEVSASQRTTPDPHGPQPAYFWEASADGSRVLFTSSAELTNDANTGPADNAANLYEYDLPSGRLTDLTVDTNAGDANGAAVQGVVTESEDGSYVYFVAEGVLAGGAVAGQPNLYLSHSGTTTFIATLANSDVADWGSGYLSSLKAASGSPNRIVGPSFNTVRVTPDGRHLAFLSTKSLTGYDNTDANTGEADAEVFSYDASAGSLVCVSCNLSGARPLGPSRFSGGGEVSPQETLFYVPRNFSEDGSRLFFQSQDALVPQDSNGRQDVYEYEAGRVHPVSDVAGHSDSVFLDASPSGDDVFIATADQLVPQDQDSRVDVYDARVGGGFLVPVPPPACGSGESCRPPVSPQPGVFGAPASTTFSGAGNVAPVVSKPAVKTKRKLKPKRKRKSKRSRRGRLRSGNGKAGKGAGRSLSGQRRHS